MRFTCCGQNQTIYLFFLKALTLKVKASFAEEQHLTSVQLVCVIQCVLVDSCLSKGANA